MTAQEIFEDCGYIVIAGTAEYALGPQVTTESDQLLDCGCTIVLTERIGLQEATAWGKRYFPHHEIDTDRFKYFYKAIAE